MSYRRYIVPTLISAPDETKIVDGLLYRMPPELSEQAKILSYLKFKSPGWHVIDHGYFIYYHKSEELGEIRFLGLSPSDSPPKKKLGTTHSFSKRDFENYISAMIEREQEYRERIKDEIELLIHDLRRFSTSIYQSAIATRQAIINRDAGEAILRIENTIAAQGMLRIRADILDMTEGEGIQSEPTKVPAYKKFDKVVKSFQPGSNLRGITTEIKGVSHSLVFGPDCLEIVAYILVDNALKYSPNNHKITVRIDETDTEMKIQVTSLGPELAPDEGAAIFEKGFRSQSARLLDTSGTGLGLYLARTLVSRFKGSLDVHQSGSPIVTDRGRYRDICFIVKLPIAEKLLRPKANNVEIIKPTSTNPDWEKKAAPTKKRRPYRKKKNP